MIKEISKRNAETIEQVVRDQNEKIAALHKRVDGSNATIASLTSKVESLERMVTIFKATSTGHGPSVK